MLLNDITADNVPHKTLFEELPITPKPYIIPMSVFILKITKYFNFGVFWADPKIVFWYLEFALRFACAFALLL